MARSHIFILYIYIHTYMYIYTHAWTSLPTVSTRRGAHATWLLYFDLLEWRGEYEAVICSS